MVDTIGPMVRGSEEKGRRVELAHVVGGLAGGAVTGFFFGAVGSVLNLGPHLLRWFSWTLAVLAAAALVYDSSHGGKKLGTARQTSAAWKHTLPAGAAAFFNGADLGLGWSTRIYFTSYLVALAAAAGTGHALVGALIGAAFGGARSSLVVMAHRRSRGLLSIDSMAVHRGKIVLLNGAALVQFAVLMALTALAIF